MVKVALLAEDEAERLAAVRRYDILDTPPDGAFDRVTAVAARIFGVPIAIVSIVDADRIWFKSHHGLDVEEIGRDPGLCASAILQDRPWLVADARKDPRTLANPLVAGEFGLQFYAGVPLRTHDGFNLGTLCVIDRSPRNVTADEVATLGDLAAVVMDEIELRLSATRTLGVEAEMRRRAERVAATLQESLVPPALPDVPGLQLVSRYHVAQSDQVGGDFYDVVNAGADAALVIGDVCGKGTAAAAVAASARWTLHTLLMDGTGPAVALDRLNTVVQDAHAGHQYLTAAAVAIHRTGGRIQAKVATGGHPHPLVLRGDGSVHSLGVTGPIIGWFPDALYREATADLETGDVLVLFTDGLVEAAGGEGDRRLRELMATLVGCDAHIVADRLDAVVGADRSDDAAFMVVRIR